MNFTYDDDQLIITVDAEEQAELQEQRRHDPAKFGNDSHMHDVFEELICNSELHWIDPVDTGDLTDAPILGFLAEPEPGGNGPFGSVFAGSWEDSAGVVQGWYHPVTQRWGFMSYQVRSVVDDLADHGKATFVSSN